MKDPENKFSAIFRPVHGYIFIILTSFYICAWADNEQQPAYNFSLENLNGQIISLDQYKGRDVFVIFGTTWCRHCIQLMPSLEKLQDRFSDRIQVLFVPVRQDFDTVLDFYYGKSMTYEVLPDTQGIISTKYGIQRVPSLAIIDEHGFLRYLGKSDIDTIRDYLFKGQSRQPDGKDLHLARDYMVRSMPKSSGRRFIVELDEDPEKIRKLPARIRRQKQLSYSRSVREIGARVIHNYGKWKNRIVIEMDPEKLDLLKALEGFKNVKKDRVVKALLADSAYQIRADYAWANAITGQGVNVCVVDTGIDYNHPDLQNKVTKHYDFFNDIPDGMDDNGHGTHVAGVIASQGMVYRGIAHDTALLGAKVLGGMGEGYASDVILGINWCVQEGADVINLSLGEGRFSEDCDDDDMAIAVNEAVDNGVVVVCAAGNDGSDTEIVSPACASKVIAVAAVDKNDMRASYSDGGTGIDVAAPGGDQFGGTHYPEIVSPFSTYVSSDPFRCMYWIYEQCYDNYFVVDGMRYIRAVGTSMAAPHVAGAAALLLEENPLLTPQQLKQLLEETADDLGDPGRDNEYGWGRINVERALDNMPAQLGELNIKLTDPNTAELLFKDQQFPLAVEVDCIGGDGCGLVDVYSQFCKGADCNDFVNINTDTTVLSADANPVALGALSGITVDTDVPILFDAQTVFDISAGTYGKAINPVSSLVGSELPTEYYSDDLEPGDGIGAIGENAHKVYEFHIPAGIVKRLKIKMEHYLVLHFDDPPATGWQIELSSQDGTPLGLVDSCVVDLGGGGDPPPEDCWFVTEDPSVLSKLIPGDINYLKLTSFGVEEDEWLTFNNIFVAVEYEIDPDHDLVNRYLVKFDLNAIDSQYEVTAARLKLNIQSASDNAIGDLLMVDNIFSSDDDAESLHNISDPNFTKITNPVKSFALDHTGTISINIKNSVQEAIDNGQTTIAFQLRERGNDQLTEISSSLSDNLPVLTVYQKAPADYEPGEDPQPNDPNTGFHAIAYDAEVIKEVVDDTYSRIDNPGTAMVGSDIAAEYNVGNIEPEAGVGAGGSDAEKLYSFEIPEGILKEIRIRMENYIVLQFDDPPSGWYIFVSDAEGNEHDLVDECIPISGGGGEPPAPDCWFISSDPTVLAGMNPGGTNYIKLRSHDVGDFDWLSFNALEVMVEYQVDPENDDVHRYYLKFDISGLEEESEIDSATLNLYIAQPSEDSTAEINLVDQSYNSQTGIYTVYNAQDAYYTGLTNPLKTVSASSGGFKKINVKSAVEDTIENGQDSIAFLITEENQNQLFGIGGSQGENPPVLDILLKSSLHSGKAGWNVVSDQEGIFTLRIEARTSVGTKEYSDSIVVDILDPDKPYIESVQCLVDAEWTNCTAIQYGQTVDRIKIVAGDPQQTPTVSLNVRNVFDDITFIDDQVPYVDGNFIYEAQLVMLDSGNWIMEVTASDDQQNTDIKTVSWDIPWGQIDSSLLSSSDISARKGSSFDIQMQVDCIGGECPEVKGLLQINPSIEQAFDDGIPEDYGDIGDDSGYIAVQFTPEQYPSVLRTARFFIYDQTTYPFELRIWDDKGDSGWPGNLLIAPRTVDPVVPSGQEHDVQWFDIDVTDDNIVINEGSFYIGWRQLVATKKNQVGFDMSSHDLESNKSKTWASYPDLAWILGEWFNLDDACKLDTTFCGHQMIRAIMSGPEHFSGDMPQSVKDAPLYTLSNPSTGTDLNNGQSGSITFDVKAVGQVGDTVTVQPVGHNQHYFSYTDKVSVEILQPEDLCHAANLDAVLPVNLSDLAVLSADWLKDQPPIYGDIDGNDQVNISDLLILAEYWFSDCQ